MINKTHELYNIYKKAKDGTRITKKDAACLYSSNDLLAIGYIANIVRERKNGRKTYYIVNRHINYSNVCKNSCRFCAFSRKEGSPHAWTLDISDILKKLEETPMKHISELHIVGGLHPELPFEYYITLLNTLHARYPHVHLQAFTAVEIAHMAEISGLSIKETLLRLKEAGLSSIPGGGAEVFSNRLRQAVCPEKLSGKEWLHIMRIAHSLDIRSNATMLYGHVETINERLNHLMQLRNLQDETGGFMSFIPLPYHPENTKLGGRGPTGYDSLKTIAISRIFLDNFGHIKSFWIMLGVKLAQVSLYFGADDLDGTVVEERITHAAGASTPEFLSVDEIRHLILEAKKIPVERDTLYNIRRNK